MDQPSPDTGGLSSAQARELLQRVGPNEITATEASGWWLALRGVATEPMFALLVVAAAVYLLIGDLGEGLLLSAFALLSVALVVVQDRRSARALEALRALATPQVRVMRDGTLQRIASRELVPGDWLVLAEATGWRPMPCCANARACRSMSRCSRASPCPWPSAPRLLGRAQTCLAPNPAAMNFPGCSPAHWWWLAMDWPR